MASSFKDAYVVKSQWPEFGHLATASQKSGWEIQSLFWPRALLTPRYIITLDESERILGVQTSHL